MTVLFKVPPQANDHGLVTVEAKPYGPVDLVRGDRVFLWWSEAQHGQGLSGHGVCSAVTVQGGLLRAEVLLTTLERAGVGFGRDQLRAFRDVPGRSPEATLAKVLYRHSLNKVVSLSAAEEAFLDGLL